MQSLPSAERKVEGAAAQQTSKGHISGIYIQKKIIRCIRENRHGKIIIIHKKWYKGWLKCRLIGCCMNESFRVCTSYVFKLFKERFEHNHLCNPTGLKLNHARKRVRWLVFWDDGCVVRAFEALLLVDCQYQPGNVVDNQPNRGLGVVYVVGFQLLSLVEVGFNEQGKAEALRVSLILENPNGATSARSWICWNKKLPELELMRVKLLLLKSALSILSGLFEDQTLTKWARLISEKIVHKGLRKGSLKCWIRVCNDRKGLICKFLWQRLRDWIVYLLRKDV